MRDLLNEKNVQLLPEDEQKMKRYSASYKVLYMLKEKGQMSSIALSKELSMTKKNVDSLVSRLSQKGKIERVSAGIYRIKK